VIKHDLKPAMGYTYRGFALSDMGRYQDALFAFDEAVRLNGELEQERTKTGEAISTMRRPWYGQPALDRAPRQKRKLARAYVHRGITLTYLGRNQDALAAFDEAIKLNVKDSEAHNNRGVVLSRMRSYQDALAAFDEAIALNAADASAHNNRGECLLMAGRNAEAEKSLARAIDLRPEDVLEPQILLAALTWRRNPSWAAMLAGTALGDPGKRATPFRRGELCALGYLLVGKPDLATVELRTATARRAPGDLFEHSLYDLLDDPSVPGLDRLRAVWEEIGPDAAGESPDAA
jgi:tetratricopeptide (TPR) repeat protein